MFLKIKKLSKKTILFLSICAVLLIFALIYSDNPESYSAFMILGIFVWLGIYFFVFKTKKGRYIYLALTALALMALLFYGFAVTVIGVW